MKPERTLVLLKPDALERCLAGRLIATFEERGLKIVGLKMLRMTDGLLERHYEKLAEEKFFPRLRKFMKSTPVVAMALEGLDAVAVVRDMAGETNAREARRGTIRGALAMSRQCNLVHASEQVSDAMRELELFFTPGEIFSYPRKLDCVLYSEEERDK